MAAGLDAGRNEGKDASISAPVSTQNSEADPEEDTSGERYDELGFALSADGIGSDLGAEAREKSNAYARAFEPKAGRRLQRFKAQQQKLACPGQWLAHTPKADLKQLLRKGVPAELRPEVWWSILGCEERRQRSKNAYSQYLSERLDARASEEIERDLTRTFPNHRKFRSADGRAELRNVLRAFARHLPEVRYCQGLNFISALLLIVFQDEERAFWALVCAMESLGVEGYYTEGMVLLRADMRVLAMLLEQRCPKIATQLNKHRVELISICSEWCITWFAKCLPIPTMLRVWDALFFEGFKVIFRVAIGIFRRVEAQLISCECFEHIMEQAKSWPRGQIEHNELLKASFADSTMRPLRRRDIVKARDNALMDIQREDQEQRRRLEAAREARLQARAAATSAKASVACPAAAGA